ncbi:hypothetical protein [Xenorhabdus nematophila]|uniref:hypothetical protein n=1 Tax=Xenorhabdus nematophila TaxID=628 RepID=UPI000A7D4C31|nr:hypothetical protein [Xenorhabdus nematophila]
MLLMSTNVVDMLVPVRLLLFVVWETDVPVMLMPAARKEIDNSLADQKVCGQSIITLVSLFIVIRLGLEILVVPVMS